MIHNQQKLKDSGIEWIGKMPEHWKLRRLGDRSLMKIYSGEAIDLSDSGYYPIYGGNGLVGYTNQYNVDDCIVLGRVGAYAGVAHDISRKIWVTDNALIVKLKTGLNKRYVYYFLKHLPLNNFATKNAQPLITLSILSFFKFCIPPPSEQMLIANYIDFRISTIHNIIENRQKMIAILQEKRQAIINQALTKGLDLNVPMKESGIQWIGKIPDHWKIFPLRHIAVNGNQGIRIGPFGSSLRSEFIRDHGFKVYGQENIIQDDLKAGRRFIDEEKFKELKPYELLPDDIMLTMMGSAGKAKAFSYNLPQGIMDSHLIRIRVNRKICTPDFVAFVINYSDSIKNQIEMAYRGAIMDGLNSSLVKSFLICIPPINEQGDITKFAREKIAELQFLLEKINAQISLLQEYRRSLIFSAVTGKIDTRVQQKEVGICQ